MQAHWDHMDRGLANTWCARTARAASVAVFGHGVVAAATVAVPTTAIAKTTPRGMPGGLVTRRMA